MGRLRDLQTGDEYPLRTVHAVGREEGADLCLADRRVSLCHAVFRYEQGAWTVRDLGSTNGTRADGKVLFAGVSCALQRGSKIAFGGLPPRFELVDAGPPLPFARAADGEAIVGEESRLILPDLPPIVWTDAWTWHLSGPSGPRRLADGEVVDAAGRCWRLFLPSPAVATERRLRLSTLTALFEVSADEEYARLSLRHPGGVIELAPRAFHYHLLALARLRRDDHHAVREDWRGWVEVDEVCRQLACTRNQLHVYLYRARRQLEEAGIVDADDIVERRGTTGPIRFGLASFEERRV